MIKRIILRAFPIMILLLASACSANSKGPVTVNIEAGDFYFKSDKTEFQVGVPYHFVVKNTGSVEHEVMIVQPIEPGKMDMEQMDSMALAHIEESDLPAGGTASIDYTFTKPYPAGSLEISCHLQGHYENGMHLPIVVK